MYRRIPFLLILLSGLAFAQHSLDDFIKLALDHSPVLKDYQYRTEINQIRQEINHAENAAFHLSLTSDYLFVPYFNNNGELVTTNPSPEAIGYDINLFDGGLYSAQVNLERNIFNGRVIDAFDRQIHIQNQTAGYYSNLEKHSLEKEVTGQYLNAYQNLLLIRLSEAVVSNLSEQLKLTGELTENGFAKPQDYLLLKIELRTQQINQRDARQNYRSNLYKLYTLCGIRDTSLVDLDPVTLTIEQPPPESMFIQKFVLDSLQTVNEQELFELKYVPQVHLFMNAGLNAVELNNIQRKFGMSAGLSLSLPLYDGRQRSLTRQKSYVAQNTIQNYRHFTDRTINMQRQELFTQIGVLKQNILDYNQQIADYNQLLTLSEKQLQQGNTSMMEHLILLRNFTEIRKNKIETEINYQIQINNYNYWNW
jgi:outer membrane protein TolC